QRTPRRAIAHDSAAQVGAVKAFAHRDALSGELGLPARGQPPRPTLVPAVAPAFPQCNTPQEPACGVLSFVDFHCWQSRLLHPTTHQAVRTRLTCRLSRSAGAAST